MSTQGKLQATAADQSAEQTRLIKGISDNILSLGIEQQRLKRISNDQHKIVNNTSTNLQTMMDNQTSLTESITIQYIKARDELLYQGKDQVAAIRASGETLLQVQAHAQNTASRIGDKLLTLQHSIVG